MIYDEPNRLTRALFLFFAIFVFSSTFSIALSQTMLGISLVLFIIVAIRGKHSPCVGNLKLFYLFAALYVLWLVISAFVNGTAVKSLLIIREEWLFLIIPTGVYLVQYERFRRRTIAVLASGVFIISLYALIQYATGVNWFKSYLPAPAPTFGYRVQGTFSTRLTFANYYGTAAMFLIGYAVVSGKALSLRARRLYVGIAVLAILVSLLTFSRGVVLATVVALIIVALLMGKRYWVPAVSLIVVLAVLVAVVPGVSERFKGGAINDLNPDYEGGRLFIWKHSLKMIEDNPVFGVGQGNFYYVYKSMLRPDIPKYRQLAHAHDDMLNVAAVGGLPDLAFYLAMWAVALSMFWRGFRDAALSEMDRRVSLAAFIGSIMFFLTSLIEATFADEEVRQLLMLIWAIGLGIWYKRQNTAAGSGGRLSS